MNRSTGRAESYCQVTVWDLPCSWIFPSDFSRSNTVALVVLKRLRCNVDGSATFETTSSLLFKSIAWKVERRISSKKRPTNSSAASALGSHDVLVQRDLLSDESFSVYTEQDSATVIMRCTYYFRVIPATDGY